MKESMPWMSVAGLVCVNVTQRKLRRDSATNWLSSTMMIQRKRERGVYDCGIGISDCGLVYFGPSIAKIPGRTTRGFLKPSDKRRSFGISVVSSKRGGPTAAITTLEPALIAL